MRQIVLILEKCLAFCIYINVSQYFAFCIYKTCTLSFTDGSHCYLHLYKKRFFMQDVFYIHKQQKTIPFYVNSIFLKPKYRELYWAIKMEFCIFEKSNNSIATKLQVKLLNNRENKIKIFSVYDTIQWLNIAVHYLNMKIK